MLLIAAVFMLMEDTFSLGLSCSQVYDIVCLNRYALYSFSGICKYYFEILQI
jgi:hypothetical protein